MASYERSGKVRVPEWWLQRVLPIIKNSLTTTTYDEIGRRCSVIAGRRSPWQHGAISKFVSGAVRTIELANALSSLYHVPCPFYTALSEREAVEIALLSIRIRAKGAADAIAEREASKSPVDDVRARGVSSAVYGEDRRPGRAKRPRPRGTPAV